MLLVFTVVDTVLSYSNQYLMSFQQELSEELKESKGKFHYRAVDLKKEDEIVAAFNWIDETLGGIYLLVNNAGLFNYSTILGKYAYTCLLYTSRCV